MEKHFVYTKIRPLMENESGFLPRGVVLIVIFCILWPLIHSCIQLVERSI